MLTDDQWFLLFGVSALSTLLCYVLINCFTIFSLTVYFIVILFSDF